ncbi:uncharacterized protein LOC135825772 [Sycon ciliatum]|uniref:uncharacterized protein LOC135825772 n=1 Tax=Sycon ciliatum TaxID=27933 RepID=UPI0031F64E27
MAANGPNITCTGDNTSFAFNTTNMTINVTPAPGFQQPPQRGDAKGTARPEPETQGYNDAQQHQPSDAWLDEPNLEESYIGWERVLHPHRLELDRLLGRDSIQDRLHMVELISDPEMKNVRHMRASFQDLGHYILENIIFRHPVIFIPRFIHELNGELGIETTADLRRRYEALQAA